MKNEIRRSDMLRGDRCSVSGYGNGELIGWDTDYSGRYGASKYATVLFDDRRVIIVLRSDLRAPSNAANPADAQPLCRG
jgi:hypothetical protein